MGKGVSQKKVQVFSAANLAKKTETAKHELAAFQLFSDFFVGVSKVFSYNLYNSSSVVSAKE